MSSFVKLTVAQLEDLVRRFHFERRVDEVHLHGTPSLRQADFAGQTTLEALRRAHERRGLVDLAWHVVIGPDGSIWPGRNPNRPPNSVAGHDGNATGGPFAVALVGDFREGDSLPDAEREGMLAVVAAVQRRFGLGPASLTLHPEREAGAECLGQDIDADALREALSKRQARAEPERPATRGWAEPEFDREREGPDRVMARWAAEAGRAEPTGPTVDEDELRLDEATLAAGRAGATIPAPASAQRGDAPRLTPGQLAALRRHVVNLRGGFFSSEGAFRTAPADVDAIFQDHLVHAHREATAKGHPLRLLLWAHGGLVDERRGLEIAHAQVAWWKRNGVYPIHFVWESGFLWALGNAMSGMLDSVSRAAARDFADRVTDPLIERAVRSIDGGKVWPAMKESARRASEKRGGGDYVAQRLAEFCKGREGVELHAVGHSAGAIFHAHFLPRALRNGVPPVRTMHLLAPAIRVDEFRARLQPLLAKSIEHLALFTMKRDWEEDDQCMRVYRKSLLYLIHHALEPEPRTPVLGLEVCLRSDPELRELFGLAGTPSPGTEVVFSKSVADAGRSASRSTTHGGFDNDPFTMNSVARRVVDRDDIDPFPAARAAEMYAPTHWPPEVAQLRAVMQGPFAPLAPAPPTPSSPAPPPPADPGGARAGRARALCVGIDGYARMPLAGCVADARHWTATLQALGFETTLLTDGAATRDAILQALGALIHEARAGDTVVFQYSGHGSSLEDLSGDEVEDHRDEALCPFDVDDGANILDDDLAVLFGTLGDGVTLTCFFDCCHSGSATRVAVGGPPRWTGGGVDSRVRYLRPTPEMNAAHRRYRERAGGIPRRAARGPDTMRNVLFAACQDNELAWEYDGRGAFSTHALRVLGAGLAGVTNEELHQRFVAAFGDDRRQHPHLDCRPDARRAPALASPAATAARTAFPGTGSRAGGSRAGEDAVLATLLTTALEVVERGDGAR